MYKLINIVIYNAATNFFSSSSKNTIKNVSQFKLKVNLKIIVTR